MAVGKKVGGLIDQYNNMLTGGKPRTGQERPASNPRVDKTLQSLQEGGIRDLGKSRSK